MSDTNQSDIYCYVFNNPNDKCLDFMVFENFSHYFLFDYIFEKLKIKEK
jgi:hypothetical protein